MKKRLLLICGILILVAVIALEATNAMNKGSTNTEEVISKPNKMAEPAQSTAESALPEPVLQGRKVNMDDAMWEDTINELDEYIDQQIAGIPVRRRSDSSGRLPRNAGVLRNADVDNAKINILLKNILSARYFSRMAENLGPFAVACLDDERNQLVGLLAADDESVFVNILDQHQIPALGGVDLIQVPLPEAEIVAEVAPESVAAQQRP